ncbi:DUF2290 domain-containing protein [Aurantimonas sp. 22II-16-19i]|uniref:DUF2290 domain-containing protein n=1 Tax=Aurantimonas sp. 22II-16-19i TaxID=1317114 RepID=UPI0009F7AF8B|nr:DUF2290 domain-containing protein [Aurantimonas sp. 22II-16-19i]ORE90943.1 hypothetical protein ATO4_19814 [Aurantimonas sp. 22II-16-19i]
MKIQKLQILVEDLVEAGFIIANRPHTSRRSGRITAVEIGNTAPLGGEKLVIESSSSHYLETLRQDRLSWLLFDASIVQIAYSMQGETLKSHRYCYLPAPFSADLRQGSDQDLLEWIEGACASDPLDSPRKSSLRFEFDPVAQAEDHAAAHLHVNTADCRLPMRAPLSVREFVGFLIKYIYPSEFSAALLGQLPFDSDPTISPAEEQGFHLNWRRTARDAAAEYA